MLATQVIFQRLLSNWRLLGKLYGHIVTAQCGIWIFHTGGKRALA